MLRFPFSVPLPSAGTLASTPTPTVGGFSDVKLTDYFADAVLWAVEKEITSGTSATTFSPSAACTRGQIATLLYRALEH